ncbi:MAG: site-2 protease family protein [Candidatus Nealsonbacteria bacterium]
MRIKFSEEELIHLLHAWAAISFAFAVVFSGGFQGLGPDFFQNMLVASVTVGLAFLLHELAHKVLAQKYGCWAEFRKFNLGLILAVVMSFFGFVIAAPGAVMISGLISNEQNGKISAIGPLTNIVLALLFFTVGIFIQPGMPFWVYLVVLYGFKINAFLAFFNMLPIPPFDGSKIMAWSMPTWVAIAAVSGAIVFFL